MHRRKRIRKSLMPSMAPMDVDGGALDHSKPLTTATREHKSTNIEALTDKLESISLKKMTDDAKKAKKPKYIDTSSLFTFNRSSRRSKASSDT